MKKNKQPIHYTERYIIDPQHPVTVNVVGCGGNGSQVLNSLARMNSALRALGHPGIFVYAIDPDRVTEANMGRQLFSPADIDAYKCTTLIGRINRFFGYDWDAIPDKYNIASGISSANITISCVDTGAARKEIFDAINLTAKDVDNRKMTVGNVRFRPGRGSVEHFNIPYYWMDFGNMMDRGQVVLGTVTHIEQPRKSEFSCRSSLPTIDRIHRDIFKDNKNDDQGPSCSLAEALGRQDLFINTNLANAGMALLWKLFREARIFYHGLYLNLETMSMNPIKIS